MKRKCISFGVLACLIAVSVFTLGQSAWAGGATKTAIGWNGINVVEALSAEEQTVLTASIHTGTPKDLVLSFTAECVLATFVKVKGTGAEETDTSQASLFVRVLVDGQEAVPGEVTLADRLMRLSAKLGEAIITDPDTGELVSAGEEFISIYERTKECNGFNFFIQDVGSGNHQIEVMARIELDPSANEAVPYNTDAFLGKRTLIVEEVDLKAAVNP